MTTQEFSNEFDILYNNIASNQAPGLTEYEKSVFLTAAQDNIVLELYSGKNAFGDSFEKTEEMRQYLNNITKTANLAVSSDSEINKIVESSTLYEEPEDLWFITFEKVTFNDPKLKCKPSNIEVVPVTQDEFSKIIKNPFRKPSTNRVLRLNISGKIELVSDYKINSYSIRYIKKLDPIILEDLPGGLTINGKSNKTTTIEIDSSLSRTILERAVLLAKNSMGLLGSSNK